MKFFDSISGLSSRRVNHVVLFISIILSFLILNAHAVQYMSVDELKPGMHGLTYTVLKGSKIVPLETEILGVARHSLGPGLDLIIAKLVDPQTQLSEAVHGMSGSPLYIDGKLVGALSRRIATFEKDGHCGFTPIADMLDVHKKMEEKRQAFLRTPIAPMSSFIHLSPQTSETTEMEMLSVPLAISGFDSSLWNKLASALGLSQPGLMAVNGGGQSTASIDADTLKPGSPLAAVMMTGDASIAGTGTLTWREGNDILAFGHPMLSFGQSNLPAATADIITTIPSYEKPFKMANTGNLVGTILEDRFSAIAGKIGVIPQMAPYEITCFQDDGSSRLVHGKFVSHPALTPLLVAAALQSALLDRAYVSRTFSYKLAGEFRIKNHPALKMDGLYSGHDSDSVFALLKMITPVEELYNQKMELLDAEALNLKIQLSEKEKVWVIDSIETAQKNCQPGDTLKVSVHLRESFGEKTEQNFDLKIPSNLKSGSFEIRAAGAEELEDDKIHRAINSAKSVDEMIYLFNQRRLANHLYVQIISSSSGEWVQNHELSSLPVSVREIMHSGNRSNASDPVSEQVWSESSVEFPGFVSGKQKIQMEFKQ